MSGSALEGFLALIYVDSAARARFQADPVEEARRAGLSEAECVAVARMDWVGLQMASRSFARKRDAKQKSARHSRFNTAWRALLRSFKIDL